VAITLILQMLVKDVKITFLTVYTVLQVFAFNVNLRFIWIQEYVIHAKMKLAKSVYKVTQQSVLAATLNIIYQVLNVISALNQ
jgi:hypothetical protein